MSPTLFGAVANWAPGRTWYGKSGPCTLGTPPKTYIPLPRVGGYISIGGVSAQFEHRVGKFSRGTICRGSIRRTNILWRPNLPHQHFQRPNLEGPNLLHQHFPGTLFARAKLATISPICLEPCLDISFTLTAILSEKNQLPSEDTWGSFSTTLLHLNFRRAIICR